LRQNVFACLTCTPPPADPDSDYNPAGVCYSCSVQCHGEHELVEIFQKRNFTCDCGTTRFTSNQPCTLRVNPETNTKGGVHSEPADPNNKYNQNFRNRFCSCSIDYNPQEQKGTMFQCLGLGTHDDGGCGEDWYHPGCLVGLGPKWFELSKGKKSEESAPAPQGLPSISEDAVLPEGAIRDANGGVGPDEDEDDPPLPEGFPGEDDFDHLICYKCVAAYPWVKRYAGTPGFLAPVFFGDEASTIPSKKRERDEEQQDHDDSKVKRVKNEQPEDTSGAPARAEAASVTVDVKKEEQESKAAPSDSEPGITCKLDSLPPAPVGQLSLFAKEGFRQHFCHCPSCFLNLKPHPQLLDEEDAYEPPLSEPGSEGGSTHGSGSIYDRGESALRNVDRVRAIEGVMAYNHLKDQLKPFFERFAASGEAISAEDVRDYFAKLRGDQEAIKEAGEAAKNSDNRQEQSGY
jgi:E3 ubiquitin-protein ligase UBR7